MLRIAFLSEFLGEPTILIDGVSVDLQALAGRLRLLENPSSEPISIHSLPFVTVQAGLQLTPYPVRRDMVLRLRKDVIGQSAFDWQYSEEGWLEASEKTERLAAANRPGHQWMNGHYADDAVVLISMGEYGANWWERVERSWMKG